jgi:hypothetical protein
MKAIRARGMIPKAFGTSGMTALLKRVRRGESDWGLRINQVAVNGGRENSHAVNCDSVRILSDFFRGFVFGFDQFLL